MTNVGVVTLSNVVLLKRYENADSHLYIILIQVCVRCIWGLYPMYMHKLVVSLHLKVSLLWMFLDMHTVVFSEQYHFFIKYVIDWHSWTILLPSSTQKIHVEIHIS